MAVKRKKFKYKVLVTFMLISLVPLMIISLSSLYLVVKTRQQNILELMHLAINNASDRINKLIREKSEGLRLVVGAPIQSITDLPGINLYPLLMSSLDTTQPLILNFIDPQGRIVARVSRDGKVSFNRQYADTIEENAVLFQAGDGSYVTKNDVDTMSIVESDVSANEDFKAARQGELYISRLDFDDEDQPFLRLAAPILNQNDQIIGIAAADIRPTEIDDSISNIPLGASGYLYVVGRSTGKVIASGNKALAKVGDTMGDIANVRGLLQKSGDYDVRDDKFTTYGNSLGTNVVIAGRPMSDLNWAIIGEWPVTDAFQVIRSILWTFLLITLGTLLILVISGLYFTGLIIKPIRALDKGAREISKGNLAWKIRLYTGDEFESLAGQFNDMIKVLKENQQLRDEFVFISAHELRTPVTAIKGYLSMVLDGTFGDIPEKIVEPLNTCNAANERLVQLVHDLLEIARNEAGKMKIEMSDIPIQGNIEQVIKELKSLADKKNIAVNYKQPADGLRIKADPDKLKEVLINLIGNAIKYTTGNGAIDIWHEQHEEGLITHIKDHGIGMTEDDVNNLFAKFFRVQNEDTANIEGTGLGLFICKEIIDRMGGEIWVESKRGEGSIFSFRLNIA